MIADADIPRLTVQEFASHMAVAFNASIRPKAGAWTMDAAGGFLRLFGFGLGKRWDTHVVTTMGRTIYVPFELGSGGFYSPWDQIAVLAHECQHVHDGTVGGILRDIRYLVSTPDRTHTEAMANVASMELHHWRYGAIEHWWTRARADAMHGYGVSAADVEVMRTHLLAAAPIVRRGGLISHAGRTAIAWLDEHAPELRAPNVRSRDPS